MSSPFLDKHLLTAQMLWQGKKTYDKAKDNASKGYSAQASAQHAQEYTTAATAFWINVPLFSVLALLAFPTSILWNGPLFVVLITRLHALRDCPPDKRLRYRVRTGLFIALFVIGLVVALIAGLISLANSSVPGVTQQ